jgi:hypothetical protein
LFHNSNDLLNKKGVKKLLITPVFEKTTISLLKISYLKFFFGLQIQAIGIRFWKTLGSQFCCSGFYHKLVILTKEGSQQETPQSRSSLWARKTFPRYRVLL